MPIKLESNNFFLMQKKGCVGANNKYLDIKKNIIMNQKVDIYIYNKIQRGSYICAPLRLRS
jgi:hypothetical protein